jgi:hypothetical protein
MHAHAHAVRTAIARAQRDNATWLTAEKQSSATGGHMEDASRDLSLPRGLKYHTVSGNEVILGLRTGSHLLLIDDTENKTSDLVRAVDGIVLQAKRVLQADPDQPLELKTSVDGTDKLMVMLTATPMGGGRVAGQLHLINGGTKTRIDPVGVVEWALV